MATTRRLTELFRALANDDLQEARALATAITRDEDKKGHRGAARMLRGALSLPHQNGKLATTAAAGQVFPGSALARLSTDVRLDEVVLTDSSRAELQGVIREWRARERLMKLGVPNRTKLLFHGAPGCGKSLTARALGHEMGLPVFVVRFDAVIGAFLGQTAIHLRQLFSFAEQTSCILLLDEIDALGKRRGNPLDVGELDRIVISLMQELEHSMPKGLVVAASNLPKHLDDALWRRFDLCLAFNAPSPKVLRKYAIAQAQHFKIKPTTAALSKASKSPSFAAARATILAEVRRTVLKSEPR